MSEVSEVKHGVLRIVVSSAHDLPGGPDLSCSIDVAHGENGGSTHRLARCGPNPVFNAAMSFPYEEGEPVEFEVKDDVNGGRVICDGLIYSDIAMREGTWSGDIRLDPQGFLKVTMDFMEAPKNPPPKASIVITKGYNFTNQGLKAAAVSLTLDEEDTRQTKVMSRNDDGVFVWQEPFEFDYDCEQHLTIRVLDGNGSHFAEANYDLWGFQNQGTKAATGQLPVADATNQTVGEIGINIVLWDPADLVKPTIPEGLPEPRSMAPPERSFTGGASSGSGPTALSPDELDSAARRAADDSEAARDAAQAAAVAASLPPAAPEPRESARISANAADDAERAAANASRLIDIIKNPDDDDGDLSPRDVSAAIQENGRKAAEARQRAEDAAKQTLERAADEAVGRAKEAARKASHAADAAAEIAEKVPTPEVQAEAAKAAAAAQKAAQHAKKCEAHAAKVKESPDLKNALEHLKIAHKEAKAAQQQQKEAEDAAREARRLAKKRQRDEKKRDKHLQERLKQQERELEALNEAERRRDADREAERRKKEQLDLHERAVHKTATAHSYHGDYIEPSIHYDNGITPAACCYIPPSRAKLEEYQAMNNRQPAYLDEDASALSTRSGGLPTPRNHGTRYRYDVTAYGVPDPELDILIEGEMQSPTCCMCCGLKFKKCPGGH